MNLQNISNSELIVRLQKLVRTERKVMHLVLVHIVEIEDRKIYADLGFDGMYSYLTKGLGYSESAAYRRLQSARLIKQIPSVAEKIESGALNLSQLTQVRKCLNENHKNGESISIKQTEEILAKLVNKNSVETQKTLALEMNLPVEVREKVKPQQDDSVRIEITLSKEQFADLEQAKSLLSHICPDGNLSEVIATLAAKFNQAKLVGRKITQPVLVTENVQTNHADVGSEVGKTSGVSVAMPKKPYRQYISLKTKRMLLTKAGHCCEYQDPRTQQRCSSRYKLEIDHVQPVIFGGSNKFANLRILCQTHNALSARRLGIQN